MKNNISCFIDFDGIEYIAEEVKGDIIIKYFLEIFILLQFNDVLELFRGFFLRVIDRMIERLIKIVIDVEIKKVVKVIKSDSLFGVDGMIGYFFQIFWEVTGFQILIEVKRFFEEGVIL